MRQTRSTFDDLSRVIGDIRNDRGIADMTNQPNAALDPMVLELIEAAQLGTVPGESWARPTIDLARQLTERLQAAVPADQVVLTKDDVVRIATRATNETVKKTWKLFAAVDFAEALATELYAALAVDQTGAGDDA